MIVPGSQVSFLDKPDDAKKATSTAQTAPGSGMPDDDLPTLGDEPAMAA